MRLFKWFISLALLIAVALPYAQAAQATPLPAPALKAAPEDSSSSIFCMPGVYMDNPGDCTPAGPSGYLTGMAQKGVTFPLAPLPGSKPDPALSYVSTNYGLVRNNNAPIYDSAEAALANKKKDAVRTMQGSFVYISYTDVVEVDGRRVYMIEPGSWMTANDVSRIGSVPLFQGLTFSSTPVRPFGWILGFMAPSTIFTKRTPGDEVQDYTTRQMVNQEVVQIFAEQQVGETNWLMIGPDEWVPEKVVAKVTPNTTPPDGVPGDRWIEVNLYEQILAVYDQRQLVFATVIASGADPFWTRPGVFQIYKKLDTGPMRGAFEADMSDAYYLEDVPWTLYYDDARALHGAYWRANLGWPQSHGCVNMTVGDSHWVYNWAQEGDWVYVWDPSGQTPTDPSLYSGGGY